VKRLYNGMEVNSLTMNTGTWYQKARSR